LRKAEKADSGKLTGYVFTLILVPFLP